MINNWNEQEVLILGGTGTLGHALTKKFIHFGVRGIRIYSRDEFKHAKMKRRFSASPVPISFLLGDVRDFDRLKMAMRGATLVINAAALKHVDLCEYNPLEAVHTNIGGADNIIRAAIENNVDRVMHISTDKAVYPVNLYGATKAVTEKLFIQANVYGAMKKPIFSCCRYGNVFGSRGSVVKIFLDQYRETGGVKLTDRRATRFWILADDAVNFILNSIAVMKGAEIFLPEMKSMGLEDFAEAVVRAHYPIQVPNFPGMDGPFTYPKAVVQETGLRPGEKLHECILTAEECEHTIRNRSEENRTGIAYIIYSPLFDHPPFVDRPTEWTSENNKTILTFEEIREMMRRTELEL